MVKHTECDKLQINSIVINNVSVGLDMKTTTYQQTEIKRGGMRVVFECPDYSEEDNKIKSEVKEILSNALQEHLKKIS